jgi:hypothetical protein
MAAAGSAVGGYFSTIGAESGGTGGDSGIAQGVAYVPSRKRQGGNEGKGGL